MVEIKLDKLVEQAKTDYLSQQVTDLASEQKYKEAYDLIQESEFGTKTFYLLSQKHNFFSYHIPEQTQDDMIKHFLETKNYDRVKKLCRFGSEVVFGSYIQELKEQEKYQTLVELTTALKDIGYETLSFD